MDEQDDRKLNMEATWLQEGEGEQETESRRESVSTLVGQEEEVDMNSLTGMLRFVNQTLAMQEDPSLWSSTGIPETRHSPTLLVKATTLSDTIHLLVS